MDAETDTHIAEIYTDKYSIKAHVHALVIARLGTHLCTAEAIAGAVCLHPRTLQRRLRAEGTSFEGIKDRVRRDTALHCLRQPDIPLMQVAERLGYSEASVLSRSCIRWFEASPVQLRRNATLDAAA